MASLTQRLRAFLGSPQGKRAVTEGRRQLSRPENQQKLRRLLSRFQQRR